MSTKKEQIKKLRAGLIRNPKLFKSKKYVEKNSLVPLTPFLPNKFFPQVKALVDNYQIIKEEVQNLREKGLFAPIKGDLFFSKKIAIDDKWKKFYVKWLSKDFEPVALQHCPKTCQIVKNVDGLVSCMFSLLEPGAYIPPHKGPYRTVVRCHLGIDTPNSDQCFIDVGGQKYW